MEIRRRRKWSYTLCSHKIKSQVWADVDEIKDILQQTTPTLTPILARKIATEIYKWMDVVLRKHGPHFVPFVKRDGKIQPNHDDVNVKKVRCRGNSGSGVKW